MRGLQHSLKDKLVLDGIDLDIREGTVFSLLGPNGAGKTTTVRDDGARSHPAAALTAVSEARSSDMVCTSAPGAAPRIRSAAASALAVFRHAMITVAPRQECILAISKPRKVLAPVTTAVVPHRSGMTVSVHRRLVINAVTCSRPAHAGGRRDHRRSWPSVPSSRR
jgi:ABC-type hemin transport system ATPase subunit